MTTSVEVKQRDGEVLLSMKPSTAAALAVGLAQISDMPGTTRRARLFYATIAALIDDGITSEASEVAIPMSGEPIALESDEAPHDIPAVPTLFAGKWRFKSHAKTETLELREKRLTAGTVYAFVEKARDESVPIPAGLIDWMIVAPLESEVTYETTTYTLTVNVTGR